jgi:signal transduction histidine kinase
MAAGTLFSVLSLSGRQATSDLVRDGHFGLVAMQERVEMAGGRFQVDTHPGARMRIRAMFQVSPAA